MLQRLQMLFGDLIGVYAYEKERLQFVRQLFEQPPERFADLHVPAYRRRPLRVRR